MIKFGLRAVAFAGLLGCLPVEAQATTDVSYTGDTYIGYGPEDTGTTINRGATYSVSADGSSATTTLSPAKGGTIISQATSVGGDVTAQGTITYYLNAGLKSGGASETVVPVHITATGVAYGSGDNFTATSQMSVDQTDTPGKYGPYVEQIFASTGKYGTLKSSFSIDMNLMLNTDRLHEVILYSQVDAGYIGGVSGQAYSMIDPTFTIDDPAYSDYQITGFPVEDSSMSTVPEPSAWAMMIMGFGLTGAVTRRKRAIVAVRSV